MSFRPSSVASGLLPLVFALGACAPSGPPASPAQLADQSRAAVDTRLQSGPWRLASWRPDDALEPMLASLLAQQYATMTIVFANGRLHADSPTVHIDRAYAVVQATGPQFVVVTTDELGGTLRTSGQFSDDGSALYFRGEIEPWRGNGELRRR
jgi:hypothetical protein